MSASAWKIEREGFYPKKIQPTSPIYKNIDKWIDAKTGYERLHIVRTLISLLPSKLKPTAKQILQYYIRYWREQLTPRMSPLDKKILLLSGDDVQFSLTKDVLEEIYDSAAADAFDAIMEMLERAGLIQSPIRETPLYSANPELTMQMINQVGKRAKPEL